MDEKPTVAQAKAKIAALDAERERLTADLPSKRAELAKLQREVHEMNDRIDELRASPSGGKWSRHTAYDFATRELVDAERRERDTKLPECMVEGESASFSGAHLIVKVTKKQIALRPKQYEGANWTVLFNRETGRAVRYDSKAKIVDLPGAIAAWDAYIAGGGS